MANRLEASKALVRGGPPPQFHPEGRIARVFVDLERALALVEASIALRSAGRQGWSEAYKRYKEALAWWTEEATSD